MLTSSCSSRSSALHFAAAAGKLQAARALLDARYSRPNTPPRRDLRWRLLTHRNAAHETPLHRAAAFKDDRMVELLLEKVPSTKLVSEYERFQKASCKQQTIVIEKHLDNNCSIAKGIKT